MIEAPLRRSVLTLVLALAPGVALAQLSDAGSARIEPDRGVAGDYGTWTLTWTAGPPGLAPGGGLRVQLPDTWHAAGRNSAKRLQATDPADDHHVSARSSREGVRLRVEVEDESSDFLVKSARRGLDGRLERYVFVVRVTLERGRLLEGDSVAVVYGDTGGGSRGMTASIVSTGPEPVLVAADVTGDGSFERLADTPTLTTRSGPAAELLLTAPSSLAVGETGELHLAAVDAHANPVDDAPSPVELSVVEGDVGLPTAVSFEPGRGFALVDVTAQSPGVVRIRASARGGILVAASNPIQVHASPPAQRVYWGDLHSHTRHSWDGVGDGAFDYARYVSGLDFYAVTDHSRTGEDGFSRGLGPQLWTEYRAATDAHDAPHRFVTLHGYEASFPAPWGHHNVYFRGAPGPLAAPEAITLPELWAALEAGRALTIPHHTGKFPAGLQIEPHDPELRRNFEIYSAHGLSEAYDPGHPLAFEQSDFTQPSRSAEAGLFAQDAWIRGLELSAVAASDDHRAHPGQPHWGLTAVVAPELTREAVFDALHDRRTWATTGQRILLDFRVEGAPMGQTVSVGPRPRLRVQAHGTDVIEWLEVLRHTPGEDGFAIAFTLRPGSPDLDWSAVDDGFAEAAIYYVRLRQRGTIRGRVPMAWSSPIWVTRQRPPESPADGRR